MLRLHWVFSDTSRSNLGSSAGGSSFLSLLLQPATSKAPTSSAAFVQRITSCIPFGQVVELHLQGALRGFFGLRRLGLLVGGTRLVATAETDQQVAAQLFAQRFELLGLGRAIEQLE